MRMIVSPLLAVLLTACKLVDQTSFGAAPQAPGVSELTRATATKGAAPLLIIRPDDDRPYADDLRRAIAFADAGRGSSGFRLVSVVPTAGSPAADAAALAANDGPMRRLLENMRHAGVTPDRVTLSGIADAHAMRRELRLYQD